MSKKAEKNGITPKQQLALDSLLAGNSKTQAARDAGVTPRTLRNWLTDPLFRRQLTRGTDQAIAHAADRLAGTLEDALTVLHQIVTDENVSTTIRLRAANLILGRNLNYAETKNILERINTLEARIEATPPPFDYP